MYLHYNGKWKVSAPVKIARFFKEEYHVLKMSTSAGAGAGESLKYFFFKFL